MYKIFMRSISAILLFLLIGAAASCGADGGGTQAQSTELSSEAAETEQTNARLAISDELPETDMEGYEFRVLARARDDFVNDIGTELEESGDVVNDAIFFRNRAIEDRFNCKISAVYVKDDGATLKTEATKFVTAGDDAYDIVMGQVTVMANTATEGYWLDWYSDLPHINLEKPWYIGNAAEALSVNRHAYCMIGEYDLDVLRFTYCMYYNKDIASDYGFENFNTVMTDGKWTYDYVYTLADSVYEDLNGDGKKGEEDKLGLSGDPYSAVVTYQYAFDNPLFTIKDNMPTLTFSNEKAHDIVVKLNSLYWNTKGGYTSGWGTGSDTWSAGNLLLYTGLFSNAENFRENEFDFGILPYPKYDESQTSYYTMSDGAHSLMTVPVTITNPQYTSMIIEALNAETYKTVIPAYYDVALKVKYSRDDESCQALDMLLDSRVFDFGYMYNNGLAFVIQEKVARNSSDTESAYASKIKSATKEFGKIIDAYLAIEE